MLASEETEIFADIISELNIDTIPEVITKTDGVTPVNDKTLVKGLATLDTGTVMVADKLVDLDNKTLYQMLAEVDADKLLDELAKLETDALLDRLADVAVETLADDGEMLVNTLNEADTDELDDKLNEP